MYGFTELSCQEQIEVRFHADRFVYWPAGGLIGSIKQLLAEESSDTRNFTVAYLKIVGLVLLAPCSFHLVILPVRTSCNFALVMEWVSGVSRLRLTSSASRPTGMILSRFSLHSMVLLPSAFFYASGRRQLPFRSECQPEASSKTLVAPPPSSKILHRTQLGNSTPCSA